MYKFNREISFGCIELSGGLYPITKATLQLSGITVMNTTMTNVLLASMASKKTNPVSITEVFKKISDQIFETVLRGAEEGQLSKAQKSELGKLVESYRELLEVIE